MSFEDYKKRRQEKNELKSALAAVDNTTSNVTGQTFAKDPDEWYPSVDKSGSGYAVIRFLPGMEFSESDERVDWIHYWTHEFEGENGWYIENCLSTLGKDDPVGEYNSILWKAGSYDDKSPEREQARKQKRKLYYRSNIFVLADSVKPENNGKIKKYRFGQGTFNFLKEAMAPKVIAGLDPEEPLLPYDLFEGANFRIVAYTEEKQGGRKDRKYDKSKWEPRSPLFKKEEQIAAIYDELCNDPKWSLKQYLDPSKFKSYETLKARLDKVLGFDFKTSGQKSAIKAPSPKTPSKPVEEDETSPWTPPEPTKVSSSVPKEAPKPVENRFSSDEDFFNSLKEETN